MDMLDSLFEYWSTMTLASSMPSLLPVSHVLLSDRRRSIRVPVGDELSQLTVAVARQQLDRVGRHGCATTPDREE